MSRAITFVLGAILGLVLGGVLALYFVSPRSAANVAGTPIQPPDPQGAPPGTAVLRLEQSFFAPVLQSLLGGSSTPAFPLSLTGGASNQPVSEIQCGKIILKSEGSGTQTAVRLETGEIIVPIAFSGNFDALGNCFDFTGWAQARLDLRFDEAQQIVLGQINVQTVNLDGVPPVISGILTPLVQSTINQRVNPVQILRGEQIALNVPITSTNTTLQGRVKDVRAEVKDGAINMYINYNFTGATPAAPASATPAAP